jgi:hypothetical protein
MSNEMIDRDNIYVNLDSRNGIVKSSSNSECRFDFAEPLNINREALKLSLSVSEFSTPNSLYNINETNNILILTLNGITTTYTFAYGKYIITSLKTYFLTTLLASFNGYSMSVNTLTGKISLTNSLYSFSISTLSTIGEIMGFVNGKSYVSSLVSSVNTLEMPYLCNFNGIMGFNVHLNNISTNNVSSYTGSRCNVIQTIMIQPETTLITYTNPSNNGFELYNTELEYLQFELRDFKNNLINLNNQPWNMIICITVVKEYNISSRFNSFSSIIKYGTYQ